MDDLPCCQYSYYDIAVVDMEVVVVVVVGMELDKVVAAAAVVVGGK